MTRVRTSLWTVDRLEPRLLLDGMPFPDLASLESPSHTVVRLGGVVDIELFDDAAPTAVANFLHYVNTGRYDKLSFDLSTAGSAAPYLRTGRLAEATTDFTSTTPVDEYAPIPMTPNGRSNAARTVALASSSAAGGSSWFIFNLADNQPLDQLPEIDRPVVFGRVIQGWSWIVSASQARQLRDTVSTNFQPLERYRVGTFGSSFAYRPVGTGDSEVMKTPESEGFFAMPSYAPDGFRSVVSGESLKLTNPNSVRAWYQVIARYEWGERDAAILTGALEPYESRVIPISVSGSTQPDLVRQDTPYGLVLRTALPPTAQRPFAIAAVWERSDQGGHTSVPFYAPKTQDDYRGIRLLSFDQDVGWILPRVEVGPNVRTYVSVLGLRETPNDANVFLRLISPTHVPNGNDPTIRLSSLRRGGWDLAAVGVPAGIYSAQVFGFYNDGFNIYGPNSVALPLVVGVSTYTVENTHAQPGTAYLPAMSMLGLPKPVDDSGAIGEVENDGNRDNTLTYVNVGADADIVFRVWRPGRAPDEAPQVTTLFIGFNERRDVPLSILGVRIGERVSISYTLNHHPNAGPEVYMLFSSVDPRGRGSVAPSRGDIVTIPFSSVATGYATFAAIDPMTSSASPGARATLSMFNPYSSPAVIVSYSVVGVFSDGTRFELASGRLAPRVSTNFELTTSLALRNKLAALPTTQCTFALQVLLNAVNIDGVVLPGMATINLTRRDADGSERAWALIANAALYAISSAVG